MSAVTAELCDNNQAVFETVNYRTLPLFSCEIFGWLRKQLVVIEPLISLISHFVDDNVSHGKVLLVCWRGLKDPDNFPTCAYPSRFTVVCHTAQRPVV